MIFIANFKQLDTNFMNNEKYRLYLNEVRKNLTAKVDRSPLMRSYGYASRTIDQPCLPYFPLSFVPFM